MLTRGENLDDFEVCGGCGQLHGAFVWILTESRTHVQRCRCDEASASERAEKWPGFDFNTVAELCRGCGTEALSSGSRWSMWFCGPCATRARASNERVGRPVVPIGPHSLMHGISLGGDATRKATDVFFARTRPLFERMSVVAEWATIVVRANIRDTGLRPNARLPLAVYLDAVRDLDRNARFDGLLEALEERSRHGDPTGPTREHSRKHP